MAERPIMLRSKQELISAMQFDGTPAGADQIGRWLRREVKVVHGVLFTVGRQGLQHHGTRGSWVIKTANGSIATKSDEVVTAHYEPAPPPQEDAKNLADEIRARWQAAHGRGEAFVIADETELVDCLTDVFQSRRKFG